MTVLARIRSVDHGRDQSQLARKQIAAFNSGDWDQLGAGLAPDSR